MLACQDDNVSSCFSTQSNSEYSDDDTESLHTRLKERITSLQVTMGTLREEIKRETELWKNELNNFDSCCGVSPDEYYERQMEMYQTALLKAEATRKEKIRREIAMASYKSQLLEIENLCNLELSRVKHNAQVLQPLQEKAAFWDKGDHLKMNSDKEETCSISSKKSSISTIHESVCELYSNMNEMFNEVADKFSEYSNLTDNDI